jgi:hypothetical protein
VANYFADRASNMGGSTSGPALVSYSITNRGLAALTSAGAQFRPLSLGNYFHSTELHVPITAFEVFGGLVASGDIRPSGPYVPESK